MGVEGGRRNALLIAADRRMFRHARLLIRSIEKNYPDHPDILFFSRNLKTRDLRRLGRNGKLKHYPLELPFEGVLPRFGAFVRARVDPSMMCGRFAIWDPRLDEYDDILYLDSDIIVVGSLDRLFTSDRPFMVQHPWPVRTLTTTEGHVGEMLAEDGIEVPEHLGNSGVMMVPRASRTPAELETIVRLLDRYRDVLVWGDQSLLGLWWLERGIPLSREYRWNVCTHRWKDYRNLDPDDVRVVHFTAGTKVELARWLMMGLTLRLWRIRRLRGWLLSKIYPAFTFQLHIHRLLIPPRNLIRAMTRRRAREGA